MGSTMFCNGCHWLSLTEYEQNALFSKYGKVIHGGYPPNIVRHKDCVEYKPITSNQDVKLVRSKPWQVEK